MEACPFCRIARGELGARVLLEDDLAMAFEDIHPQARVHVLVIPKVHLVSLNKLNPEDESLVGHLMVLAAKVAEMKGIAGSGYRVVVNTNGDGGQTVFHLHLHVLGGRRLSWPPG